MGRPKAHPNLPEYMVKVGAAYKVKRPIPEHAWAEFPELKGKARIKVVSLGADEKIAKRKFLTAIEEIEKRIERSEIKASISGKDLSRSEAKLYEPKEIIDAIDNWQRRRIEANHKFGQERELKQLHGVDTPLEEFNGRDLISHRLDAISAMSRRVMKEEGGRAKRPHFIEFNGACFSARGEFDAYSAIPDFHEKLALTLNEYGINLRSDAPVLAKAFVVEAFAEAWSRILKSELHWLCGSELHRIETEAESAQPQEGGETSLTEKPDKNTLESVFEGYLKSKRRKDIGTKRRHWKALVEYFGNIDISKINSPELEEFKISLSTTPKTRKSKYSGIEKSKLKQVLIEDGSDIQKFDYLSEKTLYTYFANYKRVFEFAFDLGMIGKNPVNKTVMPVKPKYDDRKIEVRAYTDDEIVSMFSKPIFTGCSKVRAMSKTRGVINWGYRNKVGNIILKDGRYFMPILALYTGARMEELGGAKVADIKIHNGIFFLDLRYRLLKTPASRRIIPLHPILTEDFKFLDFVDERRRAGDVYLFPEFDSGDIANGKLEGEEAREEDFEDTDPHVVKRTSTYSRWFGKWRKANDFVDKTTNFHSLRHTFKHALRRDDSSDSTGNEEFSDLLTGHSSPQIGRKYGKQLDRMVEYLPKLYREIIKVRFPDFPLPDR
jgi:integrase